MSNENTSAIVSKVWSFCNPLRDIGVGYGDYLEQLTYLLFLKMADEFSKPPYNRKLPIPTENNWESLTSRRGDELEQHYSKTLNVLSRQKGVLGQIFVQSQNKIKEPAMLYKIIDMIDKEQWATLGADIKGTIYEGLLEKNAEDTKSGAGQYFTPRALIRAMVECVQPEPMKTIADPACGTGGFFLAAYDFIAKQKLDKTQKHFLKHETFFGNEIVPNTRRMCLMNLFLHNIGDFESENFISPADALISDSGLRVDYVLANPPFGRKSSMTATIEEGETHGAITSAPVGCHIGAQIMFVLKLPKHRRLPAARVHLPARGEHDHRQRRPLRCDGRRGVHPRPGGRTLRGTQQRRRYRRRGHRRPRLRVHDGRSCGGAGADRAQLRRRHVRRHRLRAR